MDNCGNNDGRSQDHIKHFVVKDSVTLQVLLQEYSTLLSFTEALHADLASDIQLSKAYHTITVFLFFLEKNSMRDSYYAMYVYIYVY